MTQTLIATEELKHLASSDNANELTRRLARECLANREAQPVGEIHTVAESRHPGVNIHMFNSEKIIPNGTKLYTAPPAPAVPEDLVSAVNRLLDCDGTRGHFSAIRCGDAREEVERLLAQPVSQRYTLNSPVIPDGWKLVPIDATRAMIDAAQMVEEDGYDAMHKAMLAAAPEGGNG
ncbi:hypothetical protein [Serratia marcescens]|uniref:hypothetical protein n=1 Tax=Serratia marcescens TaxID=615 RepID=UPI0019817CFD|nr:hypothetical protein [Serratia marcescens]MBN3976456.1 hypothetical protein [Serratia marcescens]